MKKLVPLFLDLEGRKVVIFGGGAVAERKAIFFSEGGKVKIISREFTEGLFDMGERGLVDLFEADLSPGEKIGDLLEGAFIAVPATSDAALNRYIGEQAEALGILVNSVDGAGGVGGVVVPSVVRRGPISLAISTESPALTKFMRMKLDKEMAGYEGMARLLRRIRRELKGRVPEQKERSGIIWDILSDDEVWRLLPLSYEKAYMRAREHAPQDERDSLDAGDPPKGLDRRD